MCEAENGERLNVNADSAATVVAQALGAEKLVFLSDVNGVRTHKDDPESLVHSLSAEDARSMIASGQIEDGMIPKVEACLETLAHRKRRPLYELHHRSLPLYTALYHWQPHTGAHRGCTE